MISRRQFTKRSVAAAGAVASRRLWFPQADGQDLPSTPPLSEFNYGDVTITSTLHEAQRRETHEVLMNMSEDSLLSPFARWPNNQRQVQTWGVGTTTTQITIGTKTTPASLPVQHSVSGCRRWREITPSPVRRKRVKKCCG